MSKAIYITSSEPFSGKSVITLGIINLLAAKVKKIAYFKPVINEDPSVSRDAHIETIISQFGLDIKYEDAYAFTYDEILQYRSRGDNAFIIDKIISSYKKLEETNDFVVVEGSDFSIEGASFEFDINVEIAKNLGIPVILICKGNGHSAEEVANGALAIYQAFNEKDVQVIAIIANKIKADGVEELKRTFADRLPKQVLQSVIPMDKDLGNPTMREVADAVGGKILFGENQINNQVDNSIVGAMQLRNCLTRLKENTLIVTPGDRADIIVAMLQANLSKNYPKVAGMILTGGLEPEEPILKLMEGLESVLPIILVETGTFATVNTVGNIQSRIYATDKNKIDLAISTFEKYVDAKAIEDKIVTFVPEGITPRMFQYQLVKRAKSHKKHIVLPEGNDDRVLIAAAKLVKQDIVKLTILGKEEEIKAAVKRLNISLDFDKVNIVDPVTSDRYHDYVETLYELRKDKNVNMEMARDMMTDVSYYGTMMVHKGEADGMVSGAIHTTQHTIRPALQFVKTKPGVNTVSSVFFMCLPDRVSVFGDCAVNPNPTSEQLADIAISSAESSLNFGIEPKIAMLSYSSGTSGQGEDVEKVRKATEIIKQRRPDLKVEGPIQYDAAVDPAVGKQKMPNSPVAGQASVLIFPDLNTGNNTYKAVQRETGALAIGPMLQGLNKPVNDLSRGCTIDDIFNTVVITAIQAQG
ncbi:phosphate acetyltransferase [Ferruginibacter lapsinanis]|uniref:phosphate acetyltransferase n=1 Tax=Ferruginibacter lapsinanis TaxID=563172 RepID=UPI001E3ECCAE|nr:phosphate acetyltransferase [Ferruginibacter lapsinanis]UEG50382.1 phosphate acetyltransferase [Ferruginibacter lapsinanis]